MTSARLHPTGLIAYRDPKGSGFGWGAVQLNMLYGNLLYSVKLRRRTPQLPPFGCCVGNWAVTVPSNSRSVPRLQGQPLSARRVPSIRVCCMVQTARPHPSFLSGHISIPCPNPRLELHDFLSFLDTSRSTPLTFKMVCHILSSPSAHPVRSLEQNADTCDLTDDIKAAPRARHLRLPQHLPDRRHPPGRRQGQR